MVKSGSTFVLGPVVKSLLFCHSMAVGHALVGWLVGGHVGHSCVKVKCLKTP
jgi:hypothetical protein